MDEIVYRIKYKKGDLEIELQGDRAWVEAKFKELAKTEQFKPTATDQPSSNPVTSEKTALPESLAEFIKFKGSPTNHSILVVIFGYWLFHKEKQKLFNISDIEKCYDDVRVTESSNTSQIVNNAQSEGYFKRADEKKDGRTAWTITQLGDKFVEDAKWKNPD